MKKKEDVILIGDGGHAKIITDIIELNKVYNIIGFTSTNPKNKFFYNYPLLGDDNIMPSYFEKGVNKVAIGIGGYKDNNLRTKIYNFVKDIGFEVINVIHPKSIISETCEIGKGNVIFAGVIINPEVKIGNNIIIATGATIDHETIIKDNCLISAGVTIGANVIIEEKVLCALGSKIISGMFIHENSLIGAGAVVTNSIIENGVYVGIPAKRIK